MNFKAMSIVNDKMSDTPETDDQPVINAINDNGYQVPCVDIEYARKLERERDEAITRRMETIMQCELYEQERDEAREALREIWQSGDAFLPHVDEETITRWRKAAGWEETK